MAARTVARESFVAFRVDQYLNGTKLGHGSGFLVRGVGTACLVTNWHVVTARDPAKPSELPKDHPGSPDTLRVHFTRLRDDGRLEVVPTDVALYAQGRPLWWQHQDGRGIDVVAIPLAPPSGVLALSDLSTIETMLVTVNSDVVVLGFPYLFDGGGGALPIWKRGVIASEPDVDLDRQPKMLVDTATRPGMSGAPVFATASGNMVPEENGDTVMLAGPGPFLRFIGVLSGARTGPEDEMRRAQRNLSTSLRIGAASFSEHALL